MNVIEIVKAGALHDLDEPERQRAVTLLARADPSDPLVPELRVILDGMHARPATPSAATRTARQLRAALSRLRERPWFARALVVFFTSWALLSLLQVVALSAYGTAALSSAEVFRIGPRIRSSPLGSGEVDFLRADLAASLVATGFVVAGLYRMAQSRRAPAFTMFERAVLVSIFFTQVFAFVYSQFAAVFGLFFNLILFLAVRATLSRELALEALRPNVEESPDCLAAAAGSR